MIHFDKLDIGAKQLAKLRRDYGYTIPNFKSALKRALDRTARKLRKETARRLKSRLGRPGVETIAKRLRLYSLLAGRRKRIWLGHKYGITATRFNSIRTGPVQVPYPQPTVFPDSFYGSIKGGPILPWQRLPNGRLNVIKIPFNKDAEEVIQQGYKDVRPYFEKEFESALKGIFVRRQRRQGISP